MNYIRLNRWKVTRPWILIILVLAASCSSDNVVGPATVEQLPMSHIIPIDSADDLGRWGISGLVWSPTLGVLFLTSPTFDSLFFGTPKEQFIRIINVSDSTNNEISLPSEIWDYCESPGLTNLKLADSTHITMLQICILSGTTNEDIEFKQRVLILDLESLQWKFINNSKSDPIIEYSYSPKSGALVTSHRSSPTSEDTVVEVSSTDYSTLSSTVSITDTQTLDVFRDQAVSALAMSYAGGKVAVASKKTGDTRTTITLYDVATLEETIAFPSDQIKNLPISELQWSPLGNSLALETTLSVNRGDGIGGDGVFTLDLNSLELTKVFPNSMPNAWSPSGDALVLATVLREPSGNRLVLDFVELE